MDNLNILWMDLRVVNGHMGAANNLNEKWVVSQDDNIGRLDYHIRDLDPKLICFDFDFPDISSLKAMRRTRRTFPSLPIIMLTKQHSETLAIWALRIHVWDYFVKPLEADDLLTSVTMSLNQNTSSKNGLTHEYLLSNPLPPEVRIQFRGENKTYPAQFYVEAHYHERISEKEVAQLCGMNCTTFSRHFKKEHTTTFRDYLVKFRINKARKLLQNPKASVTDIAYMVGFNDPSYFTRVFKRIVGMSPSQYRSVG